MREPSSSPECPLRAPEATGTNYDREKVKEREKSPFYFDGHQVQEPRDHWALARDRVCNDRAKKL